RSLQSRKRHLRSAPWGRDGAVGRPNAQGCRFPRKRKRHRSARFRGSRGTTGAFSHIIAWYPNGSLAMKTQTYAGYRRGPQIGKRRADADNFHAVEEQDGYIRAWAEA